MVLALLVSSAASSPGEAKETNVLQRLLAKREKVRDVIGRQQQPAPQAHTARVERRAHLSEDEREIVTKQIIQAISGMLRVQVCKSFSLIILFLMWEFDD